MENIIVSNPITELTLYEVKSIQIHPNLDNLNISCNSNNTFVVNHNDSTYKNVPTIYYEVKVDAVK